MCNVSCHRGCLSTGTHMDPDQGATLSLGKANVRFILLL